jgi:hypothetical protein
MGALTSAASPSGIGPASAAGTVPKTALTPKDDLPLGANVQVPGATPGGSADAGALSGASAVAAI